MRHSESDVYFDFFSYVPLPATTSFEVAGISPETIFIAATFSLWQLVSLRQLVAVAVQANPEEA